MRRYLLNYRRVIAGATVACGLAASAPATTLAQPANAPTNTAGDARVDRTTGAVLVPLGSIVRYDTKSAKLPVDILIRDDAVAAVRLDLQNPKVLVITGRAVGATEVVVTFDDKTRATYSVLVQPDLDLLRKTLKQTVPTANVDVQPGVGGTIVLSGYVNKPDDADLVARISAAAAGGQASGVINAIQVGGAQHVLIEVTVAQIDRTELRLRGFSFGIQGNTLGLSATIPGNFVPYPTTVTPSPVLGGTLAPPSNANVLFGIIPSGTLLNLQALKTEGVARFLSEPKVITQSGRPALLRAGGQQAVLSPASGINGPGAILEQVGTQLEVLPIVFGNGKIYLEVTPQFRSVNAARGITTSFGFTPGFNESSVRSSVYMEPGQTYAIGGLLETQSQTTVSKIPYIGDLPFIGSFFSTATSDERETELIILVTPRLVDAMSCEQAPRRVPGQESRRPDDYELFLENIVEAPRGQRQVFVNGRYVPAYKNDPSYGKYPCQNLNTQAGGIGAGCAAPGAPAGGPAGVPVAPAPVVPATALPVVSGMPTPEMPVMAPEAPPVVPVGGGQN